MTNDERNPKSEWRNPKEGRKSENSNQTIDLALWAFVIRVSFVIRHPSFVIRHFPRPSSFRCRQPFLENHAGLPASYPRPMKFRWSLAPPQPLLAGQLANQLK